MKRLIGSTLVKILIIILLAFFMISIGFYINNQKAKISGCRESVTFTYKGNIVTYGTVESQGECWLDRNLGASRVAKNYDDKQAYGDLFQWGRLDDGHQDRNSDITTTLSTSDNPGHNKFIYGMEDPYNWRSSQNDNLWQGVSGTNNPCPEGWRLPNRAEWKTEQASWNCWYWDGNEYDKFGAYRSPLKLTAAGYRNYITGEINNEKEDRSSGHYWSTTINTKGEIYYMQYRGDAIWPFARAFGLPVRCIKD